jgi:hypothetical protein
MVGSRGNIGSMKKSFREKRRFNEDRFVFLLGLRGLW